MEDLKFDFKDEDLDKIENDVSKKYAYLSKQIMSQRGKAYELTEPKVATLEEINSAIMACEDRAPMIHDCNQVNILN